MLTVLSLAMAQAHSGQLESEQVSWVLHPSGHHLHCKTTCLTTTLHQQTAAAQLTSETHGSAQQNHGSYLESIEMILMSYAGIQKSYHFITVQCLAAEEEHVMSNISHIKAMISSLDSALLRFMIEAS